MPESSLAFLSYDGMMFQIPRGAQAVRRWIEGFN